MKNLIVIGHPDQQSFCYNGIFSTIKSEIEASREELEIIDLYRDSFTRPRTAVIDKYKKLVIWAEWIYIVSPVWWFRLTPRTEIFFDEVMTPGFAYEFINITKTYAYPKPFLKDKKIRTYVTHGAPSLPVRTLYLNSVKLRLVMGVYSFVFGWRWSLWFKTKQFWSVPFVSLKKREKYLRVVKKDIQRDLKIGSRQ
ncbi:MAG: NAD(P)H-dependent oxidoreductase [Bacteroidota bacterium]|nr:NAD(P)H-dependent oxidoreductase [Bacteroidota bacterium]